MPGSKGKITSDVSEGIVRLADFMKIRQKQRASKSLRSLAIHRYRVQRDAIPSANKKYHLEPPSIAVKDAESESEN